MRFVFIVFKEGAGNITDRIADTRHRKRALLFITRPMGSD